MSSNKCGAPFTTTNIKPHGPSRLVPPNISKQENGTEDSVTLRFVLDNNKIRVVDKNLIHRAGPHILESSSTCYVKEPVMESQGIQKGLKRKILNQWYLCPHMAVKHLPNIGAEEYEIDRNRYMCMQTRLGLVLFGVLGAKKLETFGYPDKTVTEILEMVLFKTKTPIVQETAYCTEHCKSLNNALYKHQLAGRLTKLKMHVLKLNIGKLLRVCVPEVKKWTEFGWDGKTIEEILEDLSPSVVPTNFRKTSSTSKAIET